MKQCDWTPSDTEPCVLPCPGQCVMASWSAWEGCENACNNNSGKLAFQQRVMVMQGQGGSKNSGNYFEKDIDWLPLLKIESRFFGSAPFRD